MKLYTPFVSPRVDAIVLSIEFVCCVISIFVGFFGFWFVDFCSGGILAMPVAVIIGVAASRRIDGHDPEILLRGVVALLFAVAMNIFLLTIVILPMRNSEKTTDRIRKMVLSRKSPLEANTVEISSVSSRTMKFWRDSCNSRKISERMRQGILLTPKRIDGK